MATIDKAKVLEETQQALASLFLDRQGSDFWGKTTIEIVWEKGDPKQVNVDSRESLRLI